MTDWNEVGRLLADKLQRQAAARRDAELRERTQGGYRRWALGCIDSAISKVHEVLSFRSAQFTRDFGAGYQLGRPAYVQLHRECRTCALTLRLHEDSVDVYGQWSPGAPPRLHLLLSRVRNGRPLRLVCIPGGWIDTLEQGPGFRIRSFDDSGADVTPEAIAYRATRLLTID